MERRSDCSHISENLKLDKNALSLENHKEKPIKFQSNYSKSKFGKTHFDRKHQAQPMELHTNYVKSKLPAAAGGSCGDGTPFKLTLLVVL